MNIDEEILNCVAFVGYPTEHGGFAADGTCFFVNYIDDDESFTYIVTARHLVRPHRRGAEVHSVDSSIHVRISRQTKLPFLFQTRRGDWVCHPDPKIDLCALPFDWRNADPEQDTHIGSLYVTGPTPLIATPEQIAFWGKNRIGNPIFIPSLFTGHPGEKRNVPIVRIGNIAAVPNENLRQASPAAPAYLIETKSLGGISGAPVFRHLQPLRLASLPGHDIMATGGRSVPYFLIGVVIGSYSGRYGEDFIEADEEGAVILKDADFNAGISVVLPIEKVMDVLDSDQMKPARAATLEAIRKQVGYRPTSAKPVGTADQAAQDADANPDHREDFTRLAGAASRKRTQAD